MTQSVRRIVTGHDTAGRAVVLRDEAAPNVLIRAVGGLASTQLWRTFATPADNTDGEDPVVGEIRTPPPANGSVFRIVEFEPVGAEIDGLEPSALAAALGAAPAEGAANRHPFMHRTDSIDYAIVLSGEIDMLLDDSEVHCGAGDVIIQRGTNHAWVNRGTEVCRIAFVLIDAHPVAPGERGGAGPARTGTA